MSSDLSALRDVLDYDHSSGLLTWKMNLNSRARKDGVAGCLTKSGYVQVRYRGRSYLAHRVAFYLHHGWAPLAVDHRDLDKSNNRIRNLRPANDSTNNANKGRMRNNNTGAKGVYLEKSTGKFVAQIGVNKKLTRIGAFKTLPEAAEAYRAKAVEAFGEYARTE